MIKHNKGQGEFRQFLLTEDSFNEMYLGKTETIMAQGNGYLCIRASAEERYPNKVANTFIAGTFNIASETEVTELPNTADTFSLDLMIDDKRFFLTEDNVTDYDKTLNLKTGELERTFVYSTKDNAFKFKMRRFVSAHNVHLGASKIEVTPLQKEASIVIISGIDSRTTNSGEAHFVDLTRRFFEKKYIYTKLMTNQSRIEFYINAAHRLYVNGIEDETLPQPLMERRQAFQKYAKTIAAQETLTFEKYVSYYTSNDCEEVACKNPESSYELLKDEMAKGYESLLQESIKALEEKLWSSDYIKLDSTEAIDQFAINYSMYHMFVMTPAHDARMNIGAKGLSGEGYKGHAFWDTEVFLLPRFILQNPKVARRLLEYRYLGLEGARRKAKEEGYEGAMFPWEAANPEDGEVTPIFGGIDVYTGEREVIKTGKIEIHITSDVAFGVYSYFNYTNDVDFMEQYGYEIVMETARFWSSRLETSTEDAFLHITNVIGPDEYKEHIDDNAYTNYLAKWNMEYAVSIYDELAATNQPLLDALNEKIQFNQIVEIIRERAEKIYIPTPGEDLIIDQDRTYRSLPEIDLTKYKEADRVGLIMADYNFEQMASFKVSKQADIMVLFLLFGEKWNEEIKKANFEYYEPFCLHDSSLSFSTYSILANDIENTSYSYELFKKAAMIDIGQEMHACDAGVHAASYGGVWQCIMFGFAGIRMIGTSLHVNPKLPNEINEIAFNMFYQNQPLHVEITKSSVSIENKGLIEIQLYIKKTLIVLKPNEKVEV